jgi:methylamine dehydrogenase heavy chain
MTRIWTTVLAASGLTLGFGSLAFAEEAAPLTPPVLESEMATTQPLRALRSHDLLLSQFEGGVKLIDGDTGKTFGQVYTSTYANFAIGPDHKTVYVAETYWARGNRGQRTDLLSIYGGETLSLLAEIELPGRLISDPKTRNFGLSADGRYAYVYNFQPASSVVVVDVVSRKIVGNVEIPGCGLIFPWGTRGFASLCADGTIAVVNADAKGKYKVARTEKFFDVDEDPIFDESLVDRVTGEAIFISYTGLVYSVGLSDSPRIDRPWSMQEKAGLSRATSKVGHLTWRPCGSRLAAYHRASGRLFVLMHESTHWDYAQQGTEVWVFDLKSRSLLNRLTLPQSAGTLAVSQDENAVLFAISEDRLWVLDPASGDVLRTREVISPSLVGVKDY